MNAILASYLMADTAQIKLPALLMGHALNYNPALWFPMVPTIADVQMALLLTNFIVVSQIMLATYFVFRDYNITQSFGMVYKVNDQSDLGPRQNGVVCRVR